MTFMLALDGLTDAELVDRIAHGDPAAAARFWVRHWPTALTAARGLVEPAEVPGLAAEALVGTLAAVRVGSGPQDNAAVFVIDAVHELGGDEFSADNLSAVSYPDIFPSATMAAAFASMTLDDRQLLWAALADGVPDADVAESVGITPAEAVVARETLLGVLQESYLRRHSAQGVLPECAATHSFLSSAVSHPDTAFPSETWVHLSECVVCTEAFHELAHSPVDLGPLLGAASFPGVLPLPGEVPVVAEAPEVQAAVVEAEPEAEPEADEPEHVPVAEALESAAEPEPEEPQWVVHEDEPVELAEEETVVFRPLFVSDLEPVAVAAAALDDSDGYDVFDTEYEPTSHADTRKRRSMALILGAAALVAVIALAVSLLSGGSDPTTPAAAQDPSTSAPADPTPTPTASDSPDQSPSARTTKPTASATGATASASTSADPTASKSPSTKATKTATKSPSKSPTHSSPSPSSTPTQPATSPTPTPTPTCRGLQKLLGAC